MPIPRCAGVANVMSLPFRRTMPSSGSSNPAMILSSVVLPEPLGPRIVTSSPGWTVRSTPASATTSPNRRTMALRTRSASAPATLARGAFVSTPKQRPERSPQHPLRPALLHLGSVFRLPLDAGPELLVQVGGIGRQIRSELRIGVLDRFEIETRIADDVRVNALQL